MSNAERRDTHSVTAATEAADAFIREVAEHRRVWTIQDADGIPTATSSGNKAMPFWSALSRAESVIATVPAYSGFAPLELPWDRFRDRWLSGLERDGLHVGINWSGPRALGYDLSPTEVLTRIQDELSKLDRNG